MAEHGLPALTAIFLWWFSTGAIVYLDGLPRRTFPWTLGAASLLLFGALGLLFLLRTDSSVAGAYLGFGAGLMVWAWIEITFLLGFLTGPRRSPCPTGATGWRRFRAAAETIAYHEIAILLAGGLLLALTWGADNKVGFWTFLLLAVMRLSSKLNVFLGVRNLSEEFLPRHLAYLESYFARGPMNLFFPFSLSLATGATVLLFQAALAAPDGGFQAAALTFLATMLALAVLEHWMMVLPLPATALWSWSLRPGESERYYDPETLSFLRRAVAPGNRRRS